MDTLAQFILKLERRSVEDAAEIIGVEPSDLEGAVAIWMHGGDGCYIEEHRGDFAAHIERSYYTGIAHEMASVVYFEHYVIECVDEYTEADLASLLASFCVWRGLPFQSADELLAAVTDWEATRHNVASMSWLEWFIRTWEETVANAHTEDGEPIILSSEERAFIVASLLHHASSLEVSAKDKASVISEELAAVWLRGAERRRELARKIEGGDDNG